MSMEDTSSSKTASWKNTPERGGLGGIKLTVWLVLLLGRRVLKPFVFFAAVYYTLSSRQLRRALYDFYTRLGHKPTLKAAFNNVHRYAQTLVDAIFFVRDRFEPFHIVHLAHGLLQEAKASGKGAILLGAHYGSFYCMRSKSGDKGLIVHPLMYLDNAQRFHRAMRALNPSFGDRIIEIDDNDAGFLLKARDAIAEGHFLAILGDRTMHQSVPEASKRRREEKTVTVSFLGGKVELPQGPFLIASLMRCPVYVVSGIYKTPNRYDLYASKLADQVQLPRGRREEAITAYAQAFADEIAELCKEQPDNWFNFYDYWPSSHAPVHHTGDNQTTPQDVDRHANV